MQGGRMRHFVTLERLVETTDDYGEPIKSWVKFVDLFAEIRPLLGTETYNEKQLHSEHTHKILCRYFHFNINATMRIKFDDNGRIRYFGVWGDPSNWMERDIQWIFNVRENSFEHDEEIEVH